MRIAKDQVDVKMQIPGATLRQRTDFGDAKGLGKISGEYFTLAAGVDTTPLFQGLHGDACQCPDDVPHARARHTLLLHRCVAADRDAISSGECHAGACPAHPE